MGKVKGGQKEKKRERGKPGKHGGGVLAEWEVEVSGGPRGGEEKREEQEDDSPFGKWSPGGSTC